MGMGTWFVTLSWTELFLLRTCFEKLLYKLNSHIPSLHMGTNCLLEPQTVPKDWLQ